MNGLDTSSTLVDVSLGCTAKVEEKDRQQIPPPRKASSHTLNGSLPHRR